MTMRAEKFTVLAQRLRAAADKVEDWAAVAEATAEQHPEVVPRVVVGGALRPTEALALARVDQGVTAGLDAARAHLIQAVLAAEAVPGYVGAAERALTQGRETVTRVEPPSSTG
ncbi:hypothetical protein [Crossiella sp. CA198]|uniref:hypothetical protein n=1 Tax=Crossiella sp. CA198 TaxID=3455607 RepID=UPI003F8CF86F